MISDVEKFVYVVCNVLFYITSAVSGYYPITLECGRGLSLLQINLYSLNFFC